jgi:hypothetical protein
VAHGKGEGGGARQAQAGGPDRPFLGLMSSLP